MKVVVSFGFNTDGEHGRLRPSAHPTTITTAPRIRTKASALPSSSGSPWGGGSS